MKSACLGYLEESNWGSMSTSERDTRIEECFRYDDVLRRARTGVVALQGEHPVGCSMVLGDRTTFAYLKDIVVRPEWQGRGIGTRIVDGLRLRGEQPRPAQAIMLQLPQSGLFRELPSAHQGKGS
jgi:GNAT superfamily N-acetyltransferase